MKVKRRSAILDIIRNNKIETQEELTEKLDHLGFIVTQATVSRDIRELNIIKVNTPDGTSIYSLLKQNHSDLPNRLIRIFVEAVLNIDYANNIIVIKTHEGMAMAVAAALDSMENPELMGSIAGDDTVMCIVKSEEIAIRFTKKLNDVITLG